MNTYLAKNILHFITCIRKQSLWQSLRFLEDSQWWTYDKIHSYQEMKLYNLLSHCNDNVPFYKKWFKENGYKVADINMQNLNLLPVIDKSFLRDNLNQLIAIGYKEPNEYAKTSGSTGVPLLFPKSLKASAFQLAAMYRGHKWHGVELGDKEARLWGIPTNKKARYKARLTDLLLNRFREREYNLNQDVLEDFCFRMKKRKPVYLTGYTSMVTQFAKFLLETGRNGLEYKFKMVKCTSETIHDSDRDIIEKVFGCPLVNEYGAAETGLISFQCEAGSQHLMSDCCIVEFLDPRYELDDYKLKEIVITNLDNYTLPIIRYRVGDLVTPSVDICKCERMLPLIDNVLGRTEDIIKTSTGQCWPSTILDFILKEIAFSDRGIIQYKVFQRELDSLEIQVVPGKKYSRKTEVYILKKCIENFGNQMNIEIKVVDHIPREKSGKLRDFVSTV